MLNANNKVPLETLAQAVLFSNENGYYFVTHEGDLIGPTVDRNEAVAKAALYLSNYRENNDVRE